MTPKTLIIAMSGGNVGLTLVPSGTPTAVHMPLMACRSGRVRRAARRSDIEAVVSSVGKLVTWTHSDTGSDRSTDAARANGDPAPPARVVKGRHVKSGTSCAARNRARHANHHPSFTKNSSVRKRSQIAVAGVDARYHWQNQLLTTLQLGQWPAGFRLGSRSRLWRDPDKAARIGATRDLPLCGVQRAHTDGFCGVSLCHRRRQLCHCDFSRPCRPAWPSAAAASCMQQTKCARCTLACRPSRYVKTGE